MSQIVKSAPKVLGFSNSAVVKAAVTGLIQTTRFWLERRRTRIALSHLEDHLIHDIGLDPMTRDIESTRPFWN